MLVRQMDAADVDQVSDLCEKWGYAVSPELLRDRYQEICQLAGHQILVAVVDYTVCGWIHTQGVHTLGSEPYCEIRGVVVDENKRQQGIGRQLMIRAEEWALENGYKIMRLRSGTERPEAHQFYPKLGYGRTKSQHLYQKCLS